MAEEFATKNIKVVESTSIRDLRSLVDIRPLYILPSDPLAEEVLIPGFRTSDKVDCMAGFFSSAVLADLAPGLATFIEQSKESFRLIISPLLRQEDLAAIEEGTHTPENVALEIFDTIVVTEDLLQQHTLKCLSYLLRVGRLQLQIALMKDALFHPKVWLFHSGEDVLAAHGSSNVTYAGIKKNIEQIAISKSWDDPNQRYITEKLDYQFRRLWENKEDNCLVIPAPKAVVEKLLKTYHSETPPQKETSRPFMIGQRALLKNRCPMRFRHSRRAISQFLPVSDLKMARLRIKAKRSAHGARLASVASLKWQRDQARQSRR